MNWIVEINNQSGAFQIIVCDTEMYQINLILAINKNSTETGLTAYDRGCVDTIGGNKK